MFGLLKRSGEGNDEPDVLGINSTASRDVFGRVQNQTTQLGVVVTMSSR